MALKPLRDGPKNQSTHPSSRLFPLEVRTPGSSAVLPWPAAALGRRGAERSVSVGRVRGRGLFEKTHFWDTLFGCKEESSCKIC